MEEGRKGGRKKERKEKAKQYVNAFGGTSLHPAH